MLNTISITIFCDRKLCDISAQEFLGPNDDNKMKVITSTERLAYRLIWSILNGTYNMVHTFTGKEIFTNMVLSILSNLKHALMEISTNFLMNKPFFLRDRR